MHTSNPTTNLELLCSHFLAGAIVLSRYSENELISILRIAPLSWKRLSKIIKRVIPVSLHHWVIEVEDNIKIANLGDETQRTPSALLQPRPFKNHHLVLLDKIDDTTSLFFILFSICFLYFWKLFLLSDPERFALPRHRSHLGKLLLICQGELLIMAVKP